MEQAERSAMQTFVMRRQQPATAETVDVWSSMLLQQELSAWPKRLWQKAVRTVCSEIQRALRRRTYWMPLSQGMLLLSVLWMK